MSRLVRLIGDVHGKYSSYKTITSSIRNSIQVGDMGVGFRHVDGWKSGQPMANPSYDHMVGGDHRFIRGNHDCPAVCRNHTQCIPDGTVEDDVMFVGGALSIDREWRTENYDWWPDEELSIAELYKMVDQYLEVKPRVMITHDCPQEVALAMLQSIPLLGGSTKDNYPSRTRQAFQSMWSAHSPDLWVFGHWHVSFDHVLRGTRFVCLAELEYKDIQI